MLLNFSSSAGGNFRPSFWAPLKSSLFQITGNAISLTRATTAYVTDFEGVDRKVLSGEARFTGARRVRNLQTFSQALSNGVYTRTNLASVADNAFTAPDGTPMSLVTEDSTAAASHSIKGVSVSYVAGQRFLTSGNFKANGRTLFRVGTDSSPFGGTGQAVDFDTGAVTATPQSGTPTGAIVALGGGVYRWSVLMPATSGSGSGNFNNVSLKATAGTAIYNGDGVSGAYMSAIQIEDVTGQSVMTVAEYIATSVLSAPYYGANVDGVKYFETKLDGSSIADALLRGLKSERAATQLITPTASIRDMTDASWVKTNITAAKNATGTDGIVNGGSTLTANAANGTILQTLVAAASSRTFSARVRRKTGSGGIDITQDGGSTWTSITAQLNSSTYSLVQLNASVLNASYGFRIQTNGDAIEVDWNQFEAGGIASSQIDTAGGTRNADVPSTTSAGIIDFTQGTFYAEMSTDWAIDTVNSHDGAGFGSTGRQLFSNASNAATLISVYDSTTAVQKSGLTSMATGIRKRICSWGALGQLITGDGATPASGAFDGSIGSGATIGIAATAGGANQLNGNIRNFKIYLAQATATQEQAQSS